MNSNRKKYKNSKLSLDVIKKKIEKQVREEGYTDPDTIEDEIDYRLGNFVEGDIDGPI